MISSNKTQGGSPRVGAGAFLPLRSCAHVLKQVAAEGVSPMRCAHVKPRAIPPHLKLDGELSNKLTLWVFSANSNKLITMNKTPWNLLSSEEKKHHQFDLRPQHKQLDMDMVYKVQFESPIYIKYKNIIYSSYLLASALYCLTICILSYILLVKTKQNLT